MVGCVLASLEPVLAGDASARKRQCLHVLEFAHPGIVRVAGLQVQRASFLDVPDVGMARLAVEFRGLGDRHLTKFEGDVGGCGEANDQHRNRNEDRSDHSLSIYSSPA